MSSRTTQKDFRTATHAGDWYKADAKELDADLSGWLDRVQPAEDPNPIKGCKAIIAPHAGYTYSGATAAWAYKSIDTTGIKRVFILGPSHHVSLDTCALSGCKEYETPLGNLPLDLETIQKLQDTHKFASLSSKTDEDEHSLEMHLPFIRKIFLGQDISIVPIIVGAFSHDIEAKFGALLAPYLAQEDTFWVVSSDFCHWGSRFMYTYYYPEPAPGDAPAVRLSRSVTPSAAHPIHDSIRRLDHEAMEVLTLPPANAVEVHTQFTEYLTKTMNTICGRHPIGVLLGALAELGRKNTEFKPTVKWVRYDQSNPVEGIRDSSVSYASAWIRF